MVSIPKYENYSLVELYQVMNSIRADLYPHVFEALETELLNRDSSRVAELEDCYFVLDREKYPEHAARLFSQIEDNGGFSFLGSEKITEENKYRTFWRRFGALFLDLFVVGVPVGVVVFAIRSTGMLNDLSMAYVEQVGQICGVAYYIAMHAKYGQTVGKMVTRVKILDVSEERGISWKQSTLREIVPVVSAGAGVVLLLLYGANPDVAALTGPTTTVVAVALVASLVWTIAEIVTMLFNKRRRAVHDFIARTVVVRIP